jgi:hypothetical protein
MPLGRRLDRPSRRGRIGRAAAAIRAPVAGTARGWRGVLGGVCLRLDGAGAYMEKNWGPGLRRTGGGATPTPSPNGLRHLDRSRRRPHIRSRRPTHPFRRRPAAVAAFVWAAIWVALTVANDASAGLVRGVVLLHAALAAGTTSLVPQAALKGDGTSAATSGPVPRARDSGGGLSGRRGGAGGQ